jgi:hypothetical protein
MGGSWISECEEESVDGVCTTLSVPETLHTSCDLLILVEQSTEPVAPPDDIHLARRSLGEWS